MGRKVRDEASESGCGESLSDADHAFFASASAVEKDEESLGSAFWTGEMMR